MDVSVEKLYFADTGNRRIRSVDLNSGIIDTIAGGGSVEVGDGLDAKMISFSSHAMRIAIDDTGNFLVSDAHHNRIRKINKNSGIITTVAGNGVPGYTADNVLATESSLNVPHGARCDSEGNIYIADTRNNRIRKVSSSSGIITTIAGNGVEAYTGDNVPATETSLIGPLSVDVDSDGNVYIAECNGCRIRRVDAKTNIITTVAGGAESFQDNVVGTETKLSRLRDVIVEGTDLYVVEGDNSLIRKIDTNTGVITTLAGIGTNGFSGDGGPAIEAALSAPYTMGMSKDAIYVLDTQNGYIRKIDRFTGIISLFAGNGIKGFSGDGGPALEASIGAGK